ncbi:ATP-binding protein [Nocardia sp. NPDC050712]|uniref:ATP-binding protein n=1 Tax=Nocardia sp. NPDC050712 TaxID=3155518 RepID=UPI0033D8882C
MMYPRPSAPLSLSFPADPTRLVQVRRTLRRWLADCAVDTDQAADILAATDEACANAIEHGCRHQSGGTVGLKVSAEDGVLHVTVSDDGSWKIPTTVPETNRGRGLSLMRTLMHQVHIQPSRHGTTVELRTELQPAPTHTATENSGLVDR